MEMLPGNACHVTPKMDLRQDNVHGLLQKYAVANWMLGVSATLDYMATVVVNVLHMCWKPQPEKLQLMAV